MEEENGSLDEEEANNQDSPESPAEVSKYYVLDKYWTGFETGFKKETLTQFNFKKHRLPKITYLFKLKFELYVFSLYIHGHPFLTHVCEEAVFGQLKAFVWQKILSITPRPLL